MARRYWFPTNRAARLTIVENFRAKIPNYMTALGMTQAEIDRLDLILQAYLDIDAYVESCKATIEATIEWRDKIYEDEADKSPATAPPMFSGYTPPVGLTHGILDEFRKTVDQIKVNSGYTLAIGEDLMIVGSEAPPTPENISPQLTVESRPNYTVKVNGQMKGMDAVRVEFQRKGATSFTMVGVLTSLPGELTISPQTPGDPEAGHIRAIYLKKNQPDGDYSPEYPVTVSQ